MRASYGEISGFSAVGAEELLLVNGGKGTSGNKSSSGRKSRDSSNYKPITLPDPTSPKIVANDKKVTVALGGSLE
jgi:hypothetical protein